jgi:hypothetical protein
MQSFSTQHGIMLSLSPDEKRLAMPIRAPALRPRPSPAPRPGPRPGAGLGGKLIDAAAGALGNLGGGSGGGNQGGDQGSAPPPSQCHTRGNDANVHQLQICCCSPVNDPLLLMRVSSGLLQGTWQELKQQDSGSLDAAEKVGVWMSMPYGRAPVAALRWRPPLPAK